MGDFPMDFSLPSTFPPYLIRLLSFEFSTIRIRARSLNFRTSACGLGFDLIHGVVVGISEESDWSGLRKTFFILANSESACADPLDPSLPKMDSASFVVGTIWRY